MGVNYVLCKMGGLFGWVGNMLCFCLIRRGSEGVLSNGFDASFKNRVGATFFRYNLENN